MKRFIFILSILASFNTYAANGGEGNNTGCNGVGNVNSPCNPTPTTTESGGSVTAMGGTSTSNSAGGLAISASAGGQGGFGIGGSNSSTQNQTQSQSSDRHDTTVNTNNQRVNNAGNNTGTSASTSSNAVMVEGDQAQARNPVSSAVGPTIVTGSDQCLVAVSVGFQAIGFGFAAGSAIEDTNCQALKLARQLDSMGYRAQALKLLLQDPRVAEAFK